MEDEEARKKMYQPPIPVNEKKQCSECKHCDYDGTCEGSYCLLGNGYGECHAVDSGGTCEYWEPREDEKKTQNT